MISKIKFENLKDTSYITVLSYLLYIAVGIYLKKKLNECISKDVCILIARSRQNNIIYYDNMFITPLTTVIIIITFYSTDRVGFLRTPGGDGAELNSNRRAQT